MIRSALPSAFLLFALACQSQDATPPPREARAKTAEAGKDGGNTCALWIAGVRSLCADYVSGKAVKADCVQAAGVLGQIGRLRKDPSEPLDERMCKSGFGRIRQQEEEGKKALPAVEFGEECQAVIAPVAQECVEPLGSGKEAELIRCTGQLQNVGRIRTMTLADAAQAELYCRQLTAVRRAAERSGQGAKP